MSVKPLPQSTQADVPHVLSCMLLSLAIATGADMRTLGETLNACATAPHLNAATRQLLEQLARGPTACGKALGGSG